MLIYIIALAVTSLTGVLLNVYMFWKFATANTKAFSSFHKLCLCKTIPNILISSIFAFWAIPLTIFQVDMAHFSRLQNLIFSQVLGGFGYVFGPFLQVCMATNRCVLLYFPFARMKFDGLPITTLAIFACFLLANTPVFASILTNCYLVYDPPTLVFLPEREECGSTQDFLMFLLICVISLTCNSINLAIFAKLARDKMNGISETQKSKRRRRWLTMFVQSVIQDVLQLIDITNYNFVSRIIDEEWWTFIFCCLSFSMVYTLDGAVMIYFHSDASRKKSTVTNVQVSTAISSGPVKKVSVID
ncbi:unnamed protein product [Caenorhabditis sp. 36 PRJEB53466]|nr:unnamed protein product [Caenorhabditis sp. 36 PRJEB53466]